MIVPNISRRSFLVGCLTMAAGSAFKWNNFSVNEDGGVQIVETVADSLSEDSVRLVMQELALSWEELRNAALNAGLNGEASWSEVESMIVAINKAEAA